MLFDESMKEILVECKNIAVIGAKDKPGQPVDRVGRYLINAGYNVIPVHPVRQNVWGLHTYVSIAEIPVAVDMVNVFRAPQYCAAHAREVLELEMLPKCFWMQSGITNTEAGKMLSAKEISVIEDKCIMVEHRRLGVK